MADKVAYQSQLPKRPLIHQQKSIDTFALTNYKQSQPLLNKSSLGWNLEEEVLFYRFLKINKERLQKHRFTKKYNKFAKMAEYITSKNITQCRSHYQNAIKRHSNVGQFIVYFQTKTKETHFNKIQKTQMGTQTEYFVLQYDRAKQEQTNQLGQGNKPKSKQKQSLSSIAQNAENSN